jgi:citrate lyase subunit beta / citryl-CoA lyase
VAAWLAGARAVVLRINGAETEWFEDDLTLCSLPGVAAVMVPKAESTDQLLAVAARTRTGVALLPQIETARGFANAAAIANCARVARLVFGSFDFQADLGIGGEDEELLYFRSQLVLVSRLAGILPPVDGVTLALDDAETLRAHTARARRLGFGGKLCIHPRQVPMVNECFRPTAEEVEWASKVVKASREAGGGAVSVDGRMVDRPVVLQAEGILCEAQRG